MKKINCLLLLLASSLIGYSQNADSVLLRNVSNEIMLHGTCYENLRVLTKTIGHRLSGSPQADKAVEWGRKAMTQAGADRVWLQPVDVPVWKRGAESLKLQLNGKDYVPVSMLSLGNTDGTGGKVLEREIVCVPDMDAFEALPADKVKDKIVFFNYAFRQDLINTFEGYGDAVKYRWIAVNKASVKGAAAVIIRSVSTGADDAPHTGSSRYLDSNKHIPAVAIGNISAANLAEACAKHSVKARLVSDCGMYGTKRSYNVIGEIKGSESPNDIMVVGGHLDSWDVGEGAHDDGAGCVQSIEVLRTLKALNIRPKHTIRAVLFMNEENGARGGAVYADSAAKADEHTIFAMESDAGGFVPRGVGLEMPLELKQKFKAGNPCSVPIMFGISHKKKAAWIFLSLAKPGRPLAGLLPDPQRYFDLHHSHNDVFETVSHRELKLGAWTMTAMMLMVDKNF